MIEQVEQFAHSLLRAETRRSIEIERLEFFAIEHVIGTVGVDPDVECEIDLLDGGAAKDGRLRDVAIPPFEVIVVNGVDLEDVVPAISVELRSIVSRLKRASSTIVSLVRSTTVPS